MYTEKDLEFLTVEKTKLNHYFGIVSYSKWRDSEKAGRYIWMILQVGEYDTLNFNLFVNSKNEKIKESALKTLDELLQVKDAMKVYDEEQITNRLYATLVEGTFDPRNTFNVAKTIIYRGKARGNYLRYSGIAQEDQELREAGVLK